MAGEFKLAAILEFANRAGPGVEAATKDLGGLEKAAQGIKTAIVAGGVVAAGKAAYELGVLGAQSLRTKRAFAAISGGASTATDNLDAMRRATRGAMSEQDMMASANRLMQMGLADSAAELEQVTTMATRLGSAMGKETGPAVEEFALMLANQSIPRLDTFGISAGKVRARMLELQAATPGLSREMAFMTATMEEGEAAMERLGEAVDDELLANERLAASWANLKAMAGEALAPAMAQVAGAAEKVTTGIVDQHRELEALRVEFGDMAMGQAILAERFGVTADSLDDLRQRSEGVAAAVESGRSQIDGWSSVLFGSAEAADVAAGAMGGLATSVKTVAGAFGEMVFDDEQLWDMALASGASLPALEALAQHLGIATDAEIQNTMEGYRLTEMFGAGAISAEQYAAGISALETATIDAAGGFEGLGADALMAEKGLGAMQAAQEKAVTATRDMSAKYGESEADFAAAEDARLDAIKSAQDMRTAEEEAAEATEALREAQEEATSQTHDLSDEVRELEGVHLYRLSEAARDAELKTLGLHEEMGLATDEAYEFGRNITLVNDTLHQMQGDYYVTVHYQAVGSLPPLPGVPEYQSGTTFHRGGLALIGGGRGPELVALPRGSRVWPASAPQTRAAVNNRYNYGGDTIYINDRLAAALYLESRRRERIARIEQM